MPGYGNTVTNTVATNISFDLRFDPSSAYYTNDGNWPTIEVGTRTEVCNESECAQLVFGSVTIPQTNMGWVHVDIPIGPNPEWAKLSQATW